MQYSVDELALDAWCSSTQATTYSSLCAVLSVVESGWREGGSGKSPSRLSRPPWQSAVPRQPLAHAMPCMAQPSAV